jgi:hypothetical protein
MDPSTTSYGSVELPATSTGSSGAMVPSFEREAHTMMLPR